MLEICVVCDRHFVQNSCLLQNLLEHLFLPFWIVAVEHKMGARLQIKMGPWKASYGSVANFKEFGPTRKINKQEQVRMGRLSPNKTFLTMVNGWYRKTKTPAFTAYGGQSFDVRLWLVCQPLETIAAIFSRLCKVAP